MGSVSIFTSRGRGIGIDLTSTAVHAAIVRRASWRRTPPRVVHLGCAGLPGGVLQGAHVVDPHAAGAAILAALPHRRGPFASAGFDVAMGLPEAVLRFGEMAADDASAPGATRHSPWRAGEEAERVTGLERGELAFDWLDVSLRPGHATVVAAPRVLVDGRIDAAAAAGAVLRILDDEAAAAFRACRWAALARGRAGDTATPVGETGRSLMPVAKARRSLMLYVSEASPGRLLLAVLDDAADGRGADWAFDGEPGRRGAGLAFDGESHRRGPDSVMARDGELARRYAYLALDASPQALADAVRRFGAGAGYAYVAGDPGRLTAAGLPCEALGTLLGCAIEVFDPLRGGLAASECPRPQSLPGRFAVAIGLALRAVAR